LLPGLLPGKKAGNKPRFKPSSPWFGCVRRNWLVRTATMI